MIILAPQPISMMYFNSQQKKRQEEDKKKQKEKENNFQLVLDKELAKQYINNRKRGNQNDNKKLFIRCN